MDDWGGGVWIAVQVIAPKGKMNSRVPDTGCAICAHVSNTLESDGCHGVDGEYVDR